jgi:hypothetical protein
VSELRLRVESDAVTLRRLRQAAWRDRLLLVPLWVLGAAWLKGVEGGTVCWGPIVLLGASAVLIGRQHGAPVVGARRRGARGALCVDPSGVEVEIGGSRTSFARADICGGWTETYRDREEVVLETRSGVVVRASVGDIGQARAVLRAAGVAPEQRAVAIRLGVAAAGGMRAVLVFLVLIVAGVTATLIAGVVIEIGSGLKDHNPRDFPTAALLALLAVMAGSALWALLTPLLTTTLRIGTDGVVIQRLWHRRFLSRATITSAGEREDRLVLWQRSGVPVTLRTSGRAEATAVAQRIREALADRGDPGAGSTALARLDRHGRSVADWLREARTLGAARAGYREAALDRRDLLDVLEDATAPPERRIAAAAALGAGEGEVRTRVKAAAETCADPRLRVAIEAAGAGEIEEAQIEEAVRAAREG